MVRDLQLSSCELRMLQMLKGQQQMLVVAAEPTECVQQCCLNGMVLASLQ